MLINYSLDTKRMSNEIYLQGLFKYIKLTVIKINISCSTYIFSFDKVNDKVKAVAITFLFYA